MALNLGKQKTLTLTLDTKYLFWPFMFLIQAMLIYGIVYFGSCTEVKHSGTMIQKYTELRSDKTNSDRLETVYFGIVQKDDGSMGNVSITAITYHVAKTGTTLEWTDRNADYPVLGGFFIVMAIFAWPLVMICSLIARN